MPLDQRRPLRFDRDHRGPEAAFGKERQPGAVNISIDSDNFQVIDNELGEVNIESHLKLTGEVRKPRVEGELRTDNARIEVDRLLLLFSNPYSEEALPDVISA